MIAPGLVSVTFRSLSPREIVALAAEASIVGIEWGGDVHVPPGNVRLAREVAAMTAEAGREVSAYGSYYRAGASNARGAFDAVLETAVALAAPTIRVWAGARGSSQVAPREREGVVSDLRRVSDLAAAAGVSVSTEYHADTLTDTASSAVRLFDEVNNPNLFSFWQPPNGALMDDCLSGLRFVLPHLSNVHVFHWWPRPENRRPLSEGSSRWLPYLRAVSALAGRRFASLEFVENDSVACFSRDARTLLGWLDELRKTEST